jgi:hypothetical protein
MNKSVAVVCAGASSFLMLANCKKEGEAKNRVIMEMQKVTAAAFSLAQLGYDLNDNTIVQDIVRENSPNNAFFLRDAIKDNEIVDPYGYPFRVQVRDGVVIVWSIGMNGKDERGQGDDIKLRKRVSDSK